MNNYNITWKNIIHNGWQVVPGIANIFLRNYMENCLRDLSEMQELTDIISYILLMQIKKSIYHLVMMAAEVGVVQYHQIQQKKHWFCSTQP